jgi:hypothetical protein
MLIIKGNLVYRNLLPLKFYEPEFIGFVNNYDDINEELKAKIDKHISKHSEYLTNMEEQYTVNKNANGKTEIRENGKIIGEQG